MQLNDTATSYRRHYGANRNYRYQIVASNLGEYAYLITAVGFILFFFFNKKIIKYVGQIIFAFGLLFIGLNVMSDAMKPLAQSAMFEDIIHRVSDTPILGLFVGTLLTLIVQSSSATIAVLLNLAQEPDANGQALISLQGALPILFGSNLGTTITGILASIEHVNTKELLWHIQYLMLLVQFYSCLFCLIC